MYELPRSSIVYLYDLEHLFKHAQKRVWQNNYGHFSTAQTADRKCYYDA